MSSDNKIKIIAAIFSFVQISLIFILGYTPHPDSEGYITLANDALSYNELYPVSSKIREYAFLWNIGAINAVALSLKLFESIIPLQITYTLLKGATLYFLFNIAKKITNEKTAWIAVIIYIIYPANYGEATAVLSEIPFIFFSIFAIYLFYNNKYLLSGILFAIADYIRPVSIVFIMALIICYIKEYKCLIKVISMYAISLMAIGMINLYNKNIFFCKAETGWMALTQYHWDHDSKKDFENPELVRDDSTLTFNQKDSVWRSKFVEWTKINDNKKEYLKQMPIKLIKTYISDNVNICSFLTKKEKNSEYMYNSLSMASLKNDFPYYSVTQILCIINLIIYYIIMFLFLLSFKYVKKIMMPWILVIFGTIFLMIFGHGESRFHIPYMPFIIICSAFYISNFLKHYPRAN